LFLQRLLLPNVFTSSINIQIFSPFSGFRFRSSISGAFLCHIFPWIETDRFISLVTAFSISLVALAQAIRPSHFLFKWRNHSIDLQRFHEMKSLGCVGVSVASKSFL
jgi:hypothetical protein